MSKLFELKALKGVRNDVSLESFDVDDLAVGNNVDLDEKGKLFRRQGTNLITAGSMHSLKAFNNTTLVVNNSALNTVSAAGLFVALAQGIVGRLAYAEIADDVFWTDGASAGAVSQGVNRPWGIAVPALPAVSVGAGDLRGGTYLYTVVYARRNGMESGAPACGSVTVPANSSLTFGPIAASADPLVDTIHVYVSSTSGELPYLTAIVPNQRQSVLVEALPEQALQVRTLLMGPPPAGQLLGYYNGRAYVGSGRFLWYSQPHEYELFGWENFLAFPSVLKTFAPVASGIYLGTETETMYLDGADPSEFVRKQVAPYGTVLGTEFYVRNDLLLEGNQAGMTPVWMSKTGLCLGMEGGVMQNLTSDRFILPSPLAEGASLLKIRSGTPQLVTTIYS